MKKVMDSKFLFILALSIIVLIILGIGAFYLFDDSDAVFVKDGYVLNPLSAKSEKYLFNENTKYKENLSSMIVFDDVDKVETTILKESFLHYNDGSLSFLKNGAILDLNSINGKDPVKFYNITNKSIIDRSGNGYVIESNNGDISLKNFMGRISDDKYIVVGTLEAKVPGNETNIKGDYFEIVYTEEGIINIENNEVKFNVTAEGSYIYAGDVVIDLGNKKITKGNEDIMSITSITISGDENIEIIPKAPEEKKEEGGGAGDDANNQNPNNDQNQNQQGTENGGAGDDGNGENGAGGDGDNKDDIVDDTLSVKLKDYIVGSTSITAVFDIQNEKENDNLTLKVTNLSTGRTIDEKYNVMNEQEVRVPKLSPNNKYLFTVVNERDENKYFQKIFETNEFGVNIEKSYATSNELGYKVTVDEDSDITDVRITLKKFNEETNALVDVETKQLKDLVPNIKGEHDGIKFTSLDSDSIYTVVLDNFSTDSTRYNDVYNVSLTSMTLKTEPTFGSMKQETTPNSFKLYLDSVTDNDNAITNYTYYIYEGNLIDSENTDTLTPAIEPIVKTNASAVTIGVGDEENQLKNDTPYFYKVAVEYYDNEKYVEYELDGSISLYVGSNPFITITKNDNEISYNKIGATIMLTDNSCLISMPGRDKCDGPSSIQIDVRRRDTDGEKTLPGYPLTNVEFDVDSNIIKKDLVVENLEPGKTYVIYVSGEVNGKFQILDRGEIYENEITTKYLANFEATWTDNDSTSSAAINTKVKLEGIERSNALSSADTAKVIKKVIVRLYDGAFNNNIQSQKLIASESFINTDEFNIKEKFYDNEFTVTEAIFSQIGDIEKLKELTANDNGRLSEAYTITVEGYYDVNDTHAVSIATPEHTYIINPDLYTEIKDPTLMIKEIYKNRLDNFSNLLTNGETVVGYNLQAKFDKEGFDQVNRVVNNLNIYVYSSSGRKVKFYIYENNELKLVEKITANIGNAGSYETNIYLGNGTEYGVTDEVMSRGNKYYIGFDINYTNANGTKGTHPSNINRNVPASYGLYPDLSGRQAEKAAPKINYLYIDETTTDNLLTYNYDIADIDNAIYKTGDDYNLYYYVNENEEEHSIKLTNTTDEVKSFKGTFTISGLNNGDYYTLYYKKNILKTGDIETDIVDYTIGNKDRLFDGYYQATDGNYNFKYEIINNPLTDNKVTIKILTTDEMLKRILSFRVKFADSKGNTLNKETDSNTFKLVKCDESDEVARCLQVEYIELRNAGMKSDGNNENLITVSVEALYDNGLTGYKYADKIGEGKEYPYMIMQDDSTKEAIGSYIIINNRVLMKSSPRYPTGYYTYKVNNGMITYSSQYNRNDVGTYPIYLGAQGYYISLSTINPKMISIDNMTSDNNKFSFSSITPMIEIAKTTSLINGAKVDLTLSGADIDDFCDDVTGTNCVNNSDGNKYLYIETWSDETLVDSLDKTVIPTIKVALDKNNINKSYTVDIINLLHDNKYYYNVYTYLNNNGRKIYTKLFDSKIKNDAVTHEFNSKKLNEIFDNNFSVTYRANPEGAYNDKLLDTKFSLIPYDEENEIPFNFDMTYILCDTESSECDLDNNIFKKKIDTISDSVTDSVDISSYDLVFDKDYYMYMYVTYDNYDKESNSVKKVTYPFYDNQVTATTYLEKLTSPEFVVTRKADYVDGSYVIDLTVNASDEDKVLVDGKYHIELLDSNGDIVGSLQIKESDGTYRTVSSAGEYDNYEFSLEDVTNQSLRITGLSGETKYTLKVTGNAYMNNFGVTDKNVQIVSGPDGVGHSIWTTNTYGVAFGNEITYSATENSIVVYYPGGSNFDNVREVIYDITEYYTQRHIYGSFVIGENNKYFEMLSNTDKWMFKIDPEGMQNKLGEIYTVTTAYMVYDKESGTNKMIDYTTYSSLSARFSYTEQQ